MTKAGPIRQQTMRDRNLALLLGEIARRGPMTRARLAEVTGLTKTTVSTLVAVLAETGLVRADGRMHEGERGRPGVAVAINHNGPAGLGLEINVDYLAACVLDLGRRVRYRDLVHADNRGRTVEEVLADLGAVAERALAAARRQGLAVTGAMVALPGVLDHRLLRTAPNLGWSGLPVADLLDAHLPVLPRPIGLDNEANLAALAELWFGGGAALGDFLYVSGEIGIGAGIVVSGRLFRGAHGSAGELGHVPVAPSGPACSCGGRGCLEQIAGQGAILRSAGLTQDSSREAITLLLRRLEEREPMAVEAVSRAGDALGLALTGAANLLDPDSIVLGGLFSTLAPWIRRPVQAALETASVRLRATAPRVTASALGKDAAVLGAAGAVIERLITDPGTLLAARTA